MLFILIVQPEVVYLGEAPADADDLLVEAYWVHRYTSVAAAVEALRRMPAHGDPLRSFHPSDANLNF